VELRKVQLVGRASFSVTLPPDWIKENKIKPSDQVTITREEDGSLRLAPGIIREEEKEVRITIDADRCKDPGLLRELIVGGYIKGCDSIEVVSKHTMSESHSKEIREATEGLMGMRIVESTSNRVMLQSVVDASKFPIGPLLKRLYELASSMFEDAMKALKEKDSSLASVVVQRVNEADKIFSLTRRQLVTASIDKSVLKKIGLKGPTDLTFHIVALPMIWPMTNYAMDIANNQLALGKNGINDADLQKVIRLGKMVHETFSNACEAFFKEDVILANNVVESFKPIDETNDKLRKLLGSRIKDVQVATHIMNIIRDFSGIVRYAMTIADVTIDRSVAEKSNLPQVHRASSKSPLRVVLPSRCGILAQK
jgi:phosphate uptake regulator